jgi:hypothetical protein
MAALFAGLVVAWLATAIAIDQMSAWSILGGLGPAYARSAHTRIAGLVYYSAHFIPVSAGGASGSLPLPFYVYLVPLLAAALGGWIAARLAPAAPAAILAVVTGATYALLMLLMRSAFTLSALFIVIAPAGPATFILGGLFGSLYAWFGVSVHRGFRHG